MVMLMYDMIYLLLNLFFELVAAGADMPTSSRANYSLDIYRVII